MIAPHENGPMPARDVDPERADDRHGVIYTRWSLLQHEYRSYSDATLRIGRGQTWEDSRRDLRRQMDAEVTA